MVRIYLHSAPYTVEVARSLKSTCISAGETSTSTNETIGGIESSDYGSASLWAIYCHGKSRTHNIQQYPGITRIERRREAALLATTMEQGLRNPARTRETSGFSFARRQADDLLLTAIMLSNLSRCPLRRQAIRNTSICILRHIGGLKREKHRAPPAHPNELIVPMPH